MLFLASLSKLILKGYRHSSIRGASRHHASLHNFCPLVLFKWDRWMTSNKKVTLTLWTIPCELKGSILFIRKPSSLYPMWLVFWTCRLVYGPDYSSLILLKKQFVLNSTLCFKLLLILDKNDHRGTNYRGA